jgi:hypothetical protein
MPSQKKITKKNLPQNWRLIRLKIAPESLRDSFGFASKSTHSGCGKNLRVKLNIAHHQRCTG